MNLPRRSETLAELETHCGADAQRISGRPHQSHAQSGLGSNVLKEFRWRAILSHDQINTSVPVEISHRRSALFPVHLDSGILAGNREQLASSVVSEP